VNAPAHPAWCDRSHNSDYPVHTADVGQQDIELGDEISLSVSLYQSGDDPTQVWLCEHRHDNTTVTPLTPEQAGELGRRLLAAGSGGPGVSGWISGGMGGAR
jgi:hypothetical protein